MTDFKSNNYICTITGTQKKKIHSQINIDNFSWSSHKMQLNMQCVPSKHDPMADFWTISFRHIVLITKTFQI